MDPVAIAIFAFIAITAVAFLFYALQGESEDSFEKHAKESTKLLLADTTKEKKQTGKGNKGKQKKDKKEKKDDGKLEDDSLLKEKEQPKPTPTPSSPAKKPVKEEKKEAKEQTNKQAAQSSKTKREAKEVKDESSDKENKEHVTEKKIAPEASTPAQSQNTVAETGQGKKNTKKDKKKETHAHEEAPKKKNRGPPPTDLDQHKVLGRLADIEEIEPEYISFLAQFFHDTCEKETQLVTNMSLLEKTNSDMKGKIDQHVLAKMTAERELQLALRSQDQLNRRIAQLEDEIQNDAETINQLKQTVNEHTNAATAVDDAELQRLRQAEQAQTALQNTVQSLHNELQNARQQIDALSHDLCRTRVTADLVSEMTSSIAEKDKLLVARGNEIEQLHNEFNDLELLVREMKAEMNRKDEVIIQSSSDDKLQLLRDQLEDAQKELEDREYTWHQRESDLMIEQKRLNALVDELHREIAKFEQFKEEQRALQAKLVEKERELEQKQKLITDQEIFVSREEALKAENASLKSQLDQLRAEHEEFKAANQQKSSFAATMDTTTTSSAANQESNGNIDNTTCENSTAQDCVTDKFAEFRLSSDNIPAIADEEDVTVTVSVSDYLDESRANVLVPLPAPVGDHMLTIPSCAFASESPDVYGVIHTAKSYYGSLSDGECVTDGGVDSPSISECTINFHCSSSSVTSVELACSLWDWKRLQMERRSEYEWTVELAVPIEGPVPRFKFVVDGVWQVYDKYPIVQEAEGITNNYLPIEDLNITTDDAEEAKEDLDERHGDGLHVASALFPHPLHSTPMKKGTPV